MSGRGWHIPFDSHGYYNAGSIKWHQQETVFPRAIGEFVILEHVDNAHDRWYVDFDEEDLNAIHSTKEAAIDGIRIRKLKKEQKEEKEKRRNRNKKHGTETETETEIAVPPIKKQKQHKNETTDWTLQWYAFPSDDSGTWICGDSTFDNILDVPRHRILMSL